MSNFVSFPSSVKISKLVDFMYSTVHHNDDKPSQESQGLVEQHESFFQPIAISHTFSVFLLFLTIKETIKTSYIVYFAFPQVSVHHGNYFSSPCNCRGFYTGTIVKSMEAENW